MWVATLILRLIGTAMIWLTTLHVCSVWTTIIGVLLLVGAHLYDKRSIKMPESTPDPKLRSDRLDWVIKCWLDDQRPAWETIERFEHDVMRALDYREMWANKPQSDSLVCARAIVEIRRQTPEEIWQRQYEKVLEDVLSSMVCLPLGSCLELEN